MAVINILTRLALVRRAEKMLVEIDSILSTAAHVGISADEVDPDGQMRNARKGIIGMLENEQRLGIVEIKVELAMTAAEARGG